MIDDQQMVKLFTRFQTIRRQTAVGLNSRILRPDYELPGRVRAFRTMEFIEMAGHFTPALVEAANRFLIDIHHAEGWFKVAQELDKDDRVSLIWEFAEPHLELAVGRPYSLKNLFTFAAVHLLHQSDALKDPNWKDDLPQDREICYALLEKRGVGWDSSWDRFSDFKEKIQRLNDGEFEKTTSNFRHRSQHRYRLRFDTGLTPIVERTPSEKGITYKFGCVPPLDVEKLIPQLYDQHQRAVDVFLAYWKLVNELCAAWDSKYAQS